MKFACVKELRGTFSVEMMCRLLGVSRSGFYAWAARRVCRRTEENRRLTEKIEELHEMSHGTYGSPRIHLDLVEEGFEVGRNRVARLMREAGIMGVHRRRFLSLTERDERHPVASNVIDRDFTATAPNQKWVADITYVRTEEGFLYLAVVLDLFSRRIVGWAMDTRLHTELVLSALFMALVHRRPQSGLIHHSDRGCQYTSAAFREALGDANIECSMSGTGNCYDNAVAESFFATLKTEWLYRMTLTTRDDARLAIVDFIERFYNRRRRHSFIGGIPPVRYEEEYAEQLAA